MKIVRIKIGGESLEGWETYPFDVPLPYDDNSIDQILLADTFQRMNRWQAISLMPYWFAKLRPNGLLAIETPDRDKAIDIHLKSSAGPQVMTKLGWMNVGTLALYGCQVEPDEGNRYLWTVSEILKELNAAGFFIREASHDAQFNRKGLDMWIIAEKLA